MRSILSWSLNRVIVLALLGGLASLMIDIRWEHRVELARQWETWIPLIYIGLMLIAGVIGLYNWNSWGRRVLQMEAWAKRDRACAKRGWKQPIRIAVGGVKRSTVGLPIAGRKLKSEF